MVGVRVCEIARGIRFQECFHGQSFFCRALGGQQRRSIYRSAGRCSNAPQEVDGRFRTSQILKKIRTADEFAPTKVFAGACKLEFNFPVAAHESLAGRVLLQALKAPSLCRQQLHQELRRGRPRKRRSILAVAVRVVAHWPEERQEQLAAAAELTANAPAPCCCFCICCRCSFSFWRACSNCSRTTRSCSRVCWSWRSSSSLLAFLFASWASFACSNASLSFFWISARLIFSAASCAAFS